MLARPTSILACLAAVAVGTPARADDSFWSEQLDDQGPVVVPSPYTYAWSDARMLSRIGVGLTLGGGISGFTASEIRDVIQNGVGGTWNVRVSIGTHIPIGIELNYFGSAAEIETFTDAYAGVLIGTTIEAALRYTILPFAPGTPYVFAGAGWQRYDVRDTQLALADTGMRDSDSMMEFPLGAGVAYRDPSGWVGDLRGTFRPSTDSSLLTEADGDHVRLHTWEASAAVGYEF